MDALCEKKWKRLKLIRVIPCVQMRIFFSRIGWENPASDVTAEVFPWSTRSTVGTSPLPIVTLSSGDCIHHVDVFLAF